MIGLDTNIVVRYLAQDDALQARAATRLIETNLSTEEPGFVTVVAMAEIAWVLERSYDLGRHEIARMIERMLAADTLIVECEQEVFAAMTAVKDGRGSFADALISALGAKAGCANTVTFDKKAARLPGFAAL